MAFPSGTAYHADSDADDEFERNSPTVLHTDSEASPTDSEPPSTENTPTTYGHGGDDHGLPPTIITEWTAEECAQFVASLGLGQYCDAIIGGLSFIDITIGRRLTCKSGQRTKSSEKHSWRYDMTSSRRWGLRASVTD